MRDLGNRASLVDRAHMKRPLEGCQDSKKSDLVLEDIGAHVILKCVTEYPGIKAVWLQKWSFNIRSGQIQNYLSAV